MSMSLPLSTCYCNYVYICVCKTPKFEFLTDTPVSLPISSPRGSGSVVSEPSVPVLGTTPSSGPPFQFLYWVQHTQVDLQFRTGYDTHKWTSNSCTGYNTVK